MMLFYVCSRDRVGLDPGNDAGRLISAHSVEEAVEMWVMETGRDDALVFRVPSVSPKPMVHRWHALWTERGAQCLLK